MEIFWLIKFTLLNVFMKCTSNISENLITVSHCVLAELLHKKVTYFTTFMWRKLKHLNIMSSILSKITKNKFSTVKFDIWSLLSNLGVFYTIRPSTVLSDSRRGLKFFCWCWPTFNSDRMVSKTPESDRRDHISHLSPYENLIFVQKFRFNCAPFTTVHCCRFDKTLCQTTHSHMTHSTSTVIM